jgi:hypothetical protein
MKGPRLSENQLIKNIISLSLEYKKRFGKSLGITGEVGEYKASRLLGLERAPGNINKGFDAIDPKGKKVQIKTRIYSSNSERTSAFTNFGFDYALLVLLTDKYEITEIRKARCKPIREKIDSQSYKRPALTIGDFKKLSKRIYP